MTSKRGTGRTGSSTSQGKATNVGRKTSASAVPQSTEARAHLRTVTTAPDPASHPATDAAPDPITADMAQDTAEPADAMGPFKRQDLIDAVCARSSVKRSDVKILIDLTLEELGRAMDGQVNLALAPLGKLTIKRRRPETGPVDVLTVKLRRTRGAEDGGDETPLAAASEDS